MSHQRIPSDLEKSQLSLSSSPQMESTSDEESSTKSFSSLMQGNQTAPEVEQMISPMQLPQIATAGPPNPTTLLAQMQLAQNTMSTLQSQLSTPNLQLTNTQQLDIRNKLSSAGDYLQSAYGKIGSNIDQETQQDAGGAPSKGKGPIAQFLGLLTDGIQQLESSKSHVQNIGKEGMLSPGDFLLIQLKLAKAQQELEFTGVLLSKTIDGFKQIMGVQL